MFAKKNKILYSDWIYEWLIDKKEYIKESTYAKSTLGVITTYDETSSSLVSTLK